MPLIQSRRPLHLQRHGSFRLALVVVCGSLLVRTLGFQALSQRQNALTSLRAETLRSPLKSNDPALGDVKYTRVVGKWEEQHGNFLLRPSTESGSPRALIHFLGGAIVGASPHISYRYLLERLADQGYLIVATPFSLSFDHLTTCDAVISRFERIAPVLARTYGPLPVVGVGHSCGALLQLLITSLFPDTPRAANALISFNNKPVSDAVPFFDEFVAPFFTYAAARNDTRRSSGSEIISVGLQIAKATVNGYVPSDDLLSRALQLLAPKGLEFLTATRRQREQAFATAHAAATARIPGSLREMFVRLTGPSVAAMTQSGMLPLLTETIETLEQIPRLIDEVADGARDFVPSPERVKAAARRTYRARSTLIMGYEDDNLDESDEIEELLTAAEQVIRMKRPMIQIDIQRRTLPGIHASPLLAPPLEVASRAETLLGAETAKDRLQYESADKTVDELIRWLEQSNL